MGRGQPSRAISTIEAAYELDASDEEWLGRLLDATAPDIGRGLGVAAYVYDASTVPIRVGAYVGRDAFPIDLLRPMVAGADEAYVESTWRSIAFGAASQGIGFDEVPAVRTMLHPLGIRDLVALNAYDPSGLGVWIGAAHPERYTPTESDVRIWTRIAAHVATAFRLRRRAVERVAVLTPAGRVEHAEGAAKAAPARTALRDAVRAMERARGGLRHADPKAAVEMWRGLVDARWTLLDAFESDGRRYVVAVENELRAPGPEDLAPRERQVVALAAAGYATKLIAYELGLSDSTVRVLLTRAARKLGVSSRAEVVAIHRAHARGSS